ncbi:MAG: nuclear transport factor 2 family protein [Myxococcota bacterium]
MTADDPAKPPLPPFDRDAALKKVRMAEDAWNSCDPDRVAMAYSADTHWRNRAEIMHGREEVRRFLRRKWDKELDYRLVKELWAFGERRIAVRFQYEWRDDSGQWYRAYGNENWEFDDRGLMRRREASINDRPIAEADRRWRWDRSAPRPADHPGLIDSPE